MKVKKKSLNQFGFNYRRLILPHSLIIALKNQVIFFSQLDDLYIKYRVNCKFEPIGIFQNKHN